MGRANRGPPVVCGGSRCAASVEVEWAAGRWAQAVRGCVGVRHARECPVRIIYIYIYIYTRHPMWHAYGVGRGAVGTGVSWAAR